MDSKQVPNYANELIDKIARENGFVKFSVEIDSGSQPGDGFSSEMLRVEISEDKSAKKLELVCKLAPSNEKRRKEFLSHKAFEHEAFFYQKFMPILVKFQNDKQLLKSDQFLSYPKCYGAIVDDENERYIIVLEDLRPLEFQMWDKAKPTPIENARITMRELGKLHGLSIAMKDQKPDDFNEIRHIKNLIADISDMFDNSYIKAIDSLKNEDHKNIVRHFRSNISQSFSNCFDEQASKHFGILCHGDCWNNNLLFRFNEKGVAEDIRFLDWQIIHYGSPAIDLLYNLFTSTDRALRDKEYHNLIKLYYESLSKTVKLLGSDANELFTYDDLLSELKRCGVYALLMAPLLLQISQADSSEIPNLDEMCDKVAEGESQMDFVKNLSAKGQLEFDRRLNEVFEDVIKLGYYRQHES